MKPNSDAYVLAKKVNVELSIFFRSLGPTCVDADRSAVGAKGEVLGDCVGEMALNAVLDCLRDDETDRILPERSRSWSSAVNMA